MLRGGFYAYFRAAHLVRQSSGYCAVSIRPGVTNKHLLRRITPFQAPSAAIDTSNASIPYKVSCDCGVRNGHVWDIWWREEDGRVSVV
jgi:hypothetical protein